MFDCNNFTLSLMFSFQNEWSKLSCVYVVVNFLISGNFVFLLFLGTLMYVNEVYRKEKEKLPEIKN